MNSFRLFYQNLTKPAFAPAPEVFGVVWPVLYALILIAGILLVAYAVRGWLSPWLVGVFVANIVANVAFTPVELYFGLGAGTTVIVIVIATLLYLESQVLTRSPLIFILLVPYAIWVLFALVLQISLMILN